MTATRLSNVASSELTDPKIASQAEGGEEWFRGAVKSIRLVVGQAGVLPPADLPDAVTPGNDQELPASNDLARVALISGQRAEEPHDRRIGTDEGQLFHA